MRRALLFVAAVLAVVATTLLPAGGANAASALPKCSDKNPAALTYDPEATRGLSDGKIKLKHGHMSKQKTLFAFQVKGCSAGSLGLVPAEIRGLRDSSTVDVVLVAKDSDSVSLEIDFKGSSLDPGAYELIARSKSKAVPLVLPVSVVVQDPSPWKPLLVLVGAGLLGALVLALRAQKASVTPKTFRAYFAKKEHVLILMTGVGAMVGATVPLWRDSGYYGEFDQLWPMLVAQLTAMVAASTAVTAVTGAGATND